MKNLLKIAIFAVIVAFGTSCQKEYPYPSNEYPTSTKQPKAPEVSLFGEFVITDAVMFTYDNNTGDTTQANLFNGQTLACMIKGGSEFAIDSIHKDVTTYSFYKPVKFGFGKFVLNEDTTKLYALDLISTPTIIENPDDTIQLMGGSAKQIIEYTTIDYGNKVVTMTMNNFSGLGSGVEYWTVLTLTQIKEW